MSQKRKRFNPHHRFQQEKREVDSVTEQIQSLTGETTELDKFNDFPLSSRTKKGLRDAGYAVPTDIQRSAIPLAFQGKDVLGAAKTGSGKTLAFLIPALELLWRERWAPTDGLGVIVISPTRELAYQTFEVLRKVGKYHDMSAGLVIGGKDVDEEKKRVARTNIVICTPGRLLQHMDETADFDCTSLQLLVLDEADRILDLGFAATLNAIVDNLPPERQTMLFSATQTKSVRDLARLSLKDPEYVAVHENAKYSTPRKLTQSYMVCELPDKLNLLYSFMRNHLKFKIIVFLSSCKQVKFIYETFRRLRPGVPLMALYGKQKQLKRVGIYNDFCRKHAAFLFATDIAARGLDFPAVDWVVQLDCPEDANTYIHRVGRTARCEKDGQALLVLLPSEKDAMLEALAAKKVPIEEIKVNPSKLMSVQGKMQAFCAQDTEIKNWAQKSFISYIRSVFLQSNKKVFDVHKLPCEQFAMSLGLVQPPRIRFLKKAEKLHGPTFESSAKDLANRRAVATFAEASSDCASETDHSQDERHSSAEANSKSRQSQSRNVTFHGSDDDEDDEDDLLTLRKRHLPEARSAGSSFREEEVVKKTTKAKSKARAAKTILKKKIKANTHIVFDEEGEATHMSGPEIESLFSRSQGDLSHLKPIPLGTAGAAKMAGGLNMEKASLAMREADRLDRERHRQRIKGKHKAQRQKLSELRSSELPDSGRVQLTVEDGGAYSSDGASDDEYDEEVPPAKRFKSTQKRKELCMADGYDGLIETGGTLQDDEQLALHLLSSKHF